MSWLARYRLSQFFRRSFWLLPTLAVFAAWGFGRALAALGPDLDLGLVSEANVDGVRAVIGTFAASMLTFVVYAVSALLLALQLASGQITPRLISLVLVQWRPKVASAIFVFAFCLSLVALSRVTGQTRDTTLMMATIAVNIGSIIAFFWFVQQVGIGLRPVAILQYLYGEGRKAMDSVYEAAAAGPEPSPEAEFGLPPPNAGRVIVREGASGSVLAFGRKELVLLAQRVGCVIELVPQVGDFISTGDPLARIHPPEANVDSNTVNALIAVGSERTMEQDPMFAFRIMVDIGERALSPAINDPTTAVLVLDQLHRLLRYAGLKYLGVGRAHDRDGTLRLVFPTPDWPDIVDLALIELRHYGATSIQVARRSKAMLEHLIATLPAFRSPPLRQELAALENSIARSFPEAEDRRRAAIVDLQGLGGSSSRRS